MRYFARLRYENGFQHEVPIASTSMKAIRVQVVKYK